MLKGLFSNRLFISALAFFVLCVGGNLLYLQHVKQQSAREFAKTQERLKQWNERREAQSTAETPPVTDTLQGGHFHADGTFHAEPHEIEMPEILPTESESELIPPVATEAAVWEAKPAEVPTKQVPYHPHDDLSPEEHQRVHAELKRYQSKLDDLNRCLEENNAALRARRITADESLTFLDSAGQELASIKANIKRLQGE